MLLIILAVFLVLPDKHSYGQGPPAIPDDATARTLEGKTVSLADYRGKLVFLNIWRTDCIACLIELPLLNRLQKEYASESFTVIGLSMDRGKDERVAEVAKKGNIVFPVWLGYRQPISRYTDVPVLPFLLAIGPDGRLFGHFVGSFRSYEEAVNVMNQANSFLEADEAGK